MIKNKKWTKSRNFSLSKEVKKGGKNSGKILGIELSSVIKGRELNVTYYRGTRRKISLLGYRAGEMEGRLMIFECYLEFFKCDPLDKAKLYRDSFRELKLILIKLMALLATDQTWLPLDRDIAVFSQG